MNDKIITCALCGSEMKEFESNNPQPILEKSEDRVCRDCNDYVTAARMILMRTDMETTRIICDVIANVIQMGSNLKASREMHMQMMEEE